MKKIIVLIGIMMFSLTAMADNFQFSNSSQQQSYGNNYNSGYGQSQQAQGMGSYGGSRSSWVSNQNTRSSATGIYGGQRLISLDLDFGTGDNEHVNSPFGETPDPDGKAPLSDDIVPLTIMSLLMAGLVFLRRFKR